MDFDSALEENEIARRNELIEEEILNDSWDDELNDFMTRGGWPDDVQVDKVGIRDDGEYVIATAEVQFVQSVPTGCKDLNRTYDGTVNIEVLIHRPSGTYEIKHNSLDMDDDDRDDNDDFYADDYN